MGPDHKHGERENSWHCFFFKSFSQKRHVCHTKVYMNLKEAKYGLFKKTLNRFSTLIITYVQKAWPVRALRINSSSWSNTPVVKLSSNLFISFSIGWRRGWHEQSRGKMPQKQRPQQRCRSCRSAEPQLFSAGGWCKPKTHQHWGRTSLPGCGKQSQQQPNQSCFYDIQQQRWSSRGMSWWSRRQIQTSPSPEGLEAPHGLMPPGSKPNLRTPVQAGRRRLGPWCRSPAHWAGSSSAELWSQPSLPVPSPCAEFTALVYPLLQSNVAATGVTYSYS